MGFWLCWAAAERARPALAGVGAGAATLMACLALLSQSRGTALAMAVSLVAVVRSCPGRRPAHLRAAARGAPGSPRAGSAARRLPARVRPARAGGGGPCRRAGGDPGRARGWPGVGRRRGRSQARLGRADPARRRWLGAPGSVALVVLALVVLRSWPRASAGRIEHTASAQWHAFTHLAEPGGGRHRRTEPGPDAAALGRRQPLRLLADRLERVARQPGRRHRGRKLRPAVLRPAGDDRGHPPAPLARAAGALRARSRRRGPARAVRGRSRRRRTPACAAARLLAAAGPSSSPRSARRSPGSPRRASTGCISSRASPRSRSARWRCCVAGRAAPAQRRRLPEPATPPGEPAAAAARADAGGARARRGRGRAGDGGRQPQPPGARRPVPRARPSGGGHASRRRRSRRPTDR